MKYKVLFSALMALFFLSTVRAQDTYDDLPPYRKDSTLPNFQLLRPDSSWLSLAQLPKKTAVVVIFYNPDCDHCQHEATLIAQSLDKLKKIEFIWATYAPTFEDIDAFATKYKLKGLPNMHFVKDVNYAIPSFYHLEMTPYMAAYNKNRHLVRTYALGANPIELAKILE